MKVVIIYIYVYTISPTHQWLKQAGRQPAVTLKETWYIEITLEMGSIINMWKNHIRKSCTPDFKKYKTYVHPHPSPDFFFKFTIPSITN